MATRHQPTLLLLLAISLTSQPSWGQLTDEHTPLTLHWATGTTTYQYQHHREQTVPGKPTAIDDATSTILITVQEQTPTAMHTRWEQRGLTWTSNQPTTHAQLQHLTKDLVEVPALVTLTPNGQIHSVDNIQELTLQASTLTNQFLTLLGQTSPPATIKRVRDHLQTWFQTPNAIQDLYTRDIRLFLLPFGQTHISNQTSRYETTLHHPLSPVALPAQAQFGPPQYSLDRHQLMLQWDLIADPYKGRTLLEQLTKRLLKTMGFASDKSPTLPPLTLREHATFTIALPEGWPEHMHWTRTIQLGNAIEQDHMIMQRAASHP